jgi:hypothetical protein
MLKLKNKSENEIKKESEVWYVEPERNHDLTEPKVKI